MRNTEGGRAGLVHRRYLVTLASKDLSHRKHGGVLSASDSRELISGDLSSNPLSSIYLCILGQITCVFRIMVQQGSHAALYGSWVSPAASVACGTSAGVANGKGDPCPASLLCPGLTSRSFWQFLGVPESF